MLEMSITWKCWVCLLGSTWRTRHFEPGLLAPYYTLCIPLTIIVGGRT